MNALRQRFADFLRERRIQRLSNRIKALILANNWPAAHDLAPALALEVNERSAGQVARMERRFGLSASRHA